MISRLVFPFLLFVFSTLAVQGQSVSVSLFDGSTKKVKDEIAKNRAELKKIQQDNKRFIKEQRKKFKQHQANLDSIQSDSTKNRFQKDSTTVDLSKDSVKAIRKIQRAHFVYLDSSYTLSEIQHWDSLEQKTKQEQLAAAKDKLDATYHLQKYTNLNWNLAQYRQEYKAFKDSLKQQDLLEYEEDYYKEQKRKELQEKYNQELEGYVQRELEGMSALNLPTESPEMQRLNEMKDLAGALNQPDEEIVNDAVPAENFFEGKSQVLEGAMSQTEQLKEEYAQVTDAANLDSAVKRDGVKEKPLKDRLIFGGNFQIRVDQKTSVDINPELQYLISKRLSVGLGASYRANATVQNLNMDTESTHIYGYRLLSEYFLLKGFYAHAEFESLSNGTSVAARNNQEEPKQWHHACLVGLQREFKIRGKVTGQIEVLYNFMYLENPHNNKQWNVRFGFNIK